MRPGPRAPGRIAIEARATISGRATITACAAIAVCLAAGLIGLPASAAESDLAVAPGAPGMQAAMVAPAAGGPVPHGSIDDLKSLIESKKGKPFLLTLWATWCGPCVKEIPVLNEVLTQFAPDGLELLGVSVDGLNADDDAKGRALVDAFLLEHKMAYPAWYYEGDPNRLGDLIGWTGVVPFSVLYDSQGRLKERFPGVQSRARLIDRLDERLREERKRADKNQKPDPRQP